MYFIWAYIIPQFVKRKARIMLLWKNNIYVSMNKCINMFWWSKGERQSPVGMETNISFGGEMVLSLLRTTNGDHINDWCNWVEKTLLHSARLVEQSWHLTARLPIGGGHPSLHIYQKPPRTSLWTVVVYHVYNQISYPTKSSQVLNR